MWQTYNIINAEYPATLQIIILVFVVGLLFIVGTACFEIFEVRKRGGAKPMGAFLLWKVIGGPFLIDPAFWAKLLIAAYVAHATSQSSVAAREAGPEAGSLILRPESVLLCIFVLISFAAMHRVYDTIKKSRRLRPGIRFGLLSGIFSRIIAGCAFFAVIHFVPDIEEGLQVLL